MADKRLKRKAKIITACLMTYMLAICVAIEKIETKETKGWIVIIGILLPICVFVVYKAVLSYLETFGK